MNHFKVLLLFKMMCQMVLDRYWCDITWLETDVDNLHVKKINLNDP
jgi:hypothetical protein